MSIAMPRAYLDSRGTSNRDPAETVTTMADPIATQSAIDRLERRPTQSSPEARAPGDARSTVGQ